MDIQKLKELIEFMKENGVFSLEMEEEGKKVKLSRAGANQPPGIQQISPPSQGTPPQPAPEKNKTPQDKGLIEIKAPMVGTFYRAPAPNADPYVETGKKVNTGDVLCIIEAMKLMNEIKAEIKGEIAKILAENGEPVEYGQTLFLVKPV